MEGGQGPSGTLLLHAASRLTAGGVTARGTAPRRGVAVGRGAAALSQRGLSSERRVPILGGSGAAGLAAAGNHEPPERGGPGVL